MSNVCQVARERKYPVLKPGLSVPKTVEPATNASTSTLRATITGEFRTTKI